tara:strand:- start:431 stop:862 length:432 start_codon:yes stop_codon:yes gene_type:complete
MFEASPETQIIRKIIDRMSDDDLKTKGPKDLRKPIEEAELSYGEVKNKLNNELARARRKRGIRKGRGRRVAAEFSTNQEHLRLLNLYTNLDEFGEQFNSWDDARNVIKQVFSLVDGLGGRDQLLDVVKVKRQNEKDDKAAGRQ